MMRTVLVTMCGVALLAAAPRLVEAHHSGVMFDEEKEITVQGVGPANNPNFARFGEIVQANLKEIGINVELSQSPNILTTFFANKQGDFVTTLWPARPDPSVTIQRNFTPNQITNAGNNLSPELPTLLAEIQAAETPADARAAYKKAVNIIVDEAYEVPVFFPTLTNVHRDYVTSNDIVGGNSGSPVIDAQGRLVGLAFDGNIHSISGSYWYDATSNRMIAVHPRIILTALESIYGARSIAQEIQGAE